MGLDDLLNCWERKCAGFFTSYHLEQAKLIGGNEIAIDEIQYDHALDVRFIRKDFQFSDKMIKL